MNIEDLRNRNKARLQKIDKSKIKITTYQEIEDFIKNLPSDYVGVYGIPRGGLIFATLFSYFHNVPLLQAPTEHCLVIDDDIGTGITLSPFIGKYDTAAMFLNNGCGIVPTYFHQFYSDDEFRLFPWQSKGEFE